MSAVEAMAMREGEKVWWLSVAAVSAVLVYLLAPILTPFLLSALLAYLGDPLVDRLQTYKLSRTAAVTVVFAGILLLLLCVPLLLLPLIEQQLQLLAGALPGYVERIHTQFLPWVSSVTGLDVSHLNLDELRQALAAHWQQLGGFAGSLFSALSQSGMAVLGWLASLLLVPVVTFYLLRDWDALVALVHELIPRRLESTVVTLARESDSVISAFFRGQLAVMAALSVVYIAGLWLVGLDLAFLIGLIAGLVSFVPYLGFIVGIVLAGAAALMQFGELMPLAYIAIVFGVGQMLEGMLLTPWLVGDRIGLHPVAVIFAVLAGGQLFGFLGVLLALPVAAIIMVLLRHAHQRYRDSEIYSSIR